MEHPVNPSELSPQIAKVCSPDTPAQLKTMAASGLVPLPPLDLTTVLYILAYDADQTVAQTAGQSLIALPANILKSALEQQTDKRVLDGLARLLTMDVSSTHKILFNKNTDDDTVVWITEQTTEEQTIEVIAANEERMLHCPRIIEVLYHNRAARMSTADRAVELAVRNGIELEGIQCFAEIKAAIKGQPIAKPAPEPTAEDQLFEQTLEFEEWQELDDIQIDAAFDEEMKDGDKDGKSNEKVERLEQLLLRMTPAQKIRMATLGSSQQRGLLIRDSNKLVQMAVIKAPTINESEIRRYSTFRNLPDEVVRYMAKKREWTRHYQVKLNLVHNPKTPIDISMRFLLHLRAADVRALERDKNIPQAVAKAATRLRKKRG